MSNDLITELSSDYKTLAAEWMQAKRKENEWKARRYATEAALAKFFPNMPEEGQRTFNESGFKTVAVNDLNIKIINREAFTEAYREGLIPSTLVQTELYETGFKRLRREAVKQEEPALSIYASISSLFKVEPAKTGFTVSKVA